MALSNKYNHLEIENKYYDQWIKKEYFVAKKNDKQPFSIVIPPPNVTGKLHLGHSWDNTLQDILARYNRLLGKDVLYLPGMDHAGIATQAKVDARLKEQGISRHDIGREKFLEHAWNWKEEYADTILKQWAKMGLSLDYSRSRFTLDQGLNDAVNEVFVTLYNEGLIFQGDRIINWDPVAQTALSNIEVIYKEVEGSFWTFKYPIVGSDQSLLVATTRPETMFGDVCVVVHPNDSRYSHLIGQKVINPANMQEIPIIGDDYIDIEFGTGAMKCTPAHDPNDFKIGLKYNLEMPICMNSDGTMNELAAEFVGLDRFDCRQKLVEKLEANGYLVKVEKHVHQVGHSERTDCIVEPYLSRQWFVKMEPLAKDVLKYQQNSDTKINFYPPRFEKVFCDWLENIEDWCISRQLWWGHRIPAYTNKITGELLVSKTAPIDIENWIQDPDVLDTWFSSALWPFSTLGWPNTESADLNRYYPTNVMVTGYDIILFWVVRMAFQARHFTKNKPFNDVLIHGLIRAEDGRKMSKSFGNGVDPMDVIEQYGVDALRYFLVTNSTPGLDLRYSPTKVEAAWNFINKIYQSARFVSLYLPKNFDCSCVSLKDLSLYDHWILTKLLKVLKEVETQMAQYEFVNVGSCLESFIWNDFCSWYIELSKSALASDDEKVLSATYNTLYVVLMSIIKMLSPFMPFVCEEIYLSLPHQYESINLESWPNIDYVKDEDAMNSVEQLLNIIIAVRETRVAYNLKPSLDLEGCVYDTNNNLFELNDLFKSSLLKMAHLTITTLNSEVIVVPLKFGSLHLLKSQLIDVEMEKERLLKQKQHFENEINRGEKMLSNLNFVNKAASEKVESERLKLEQNKSQLKLVLEQLMNLEK